MSSPMERQKSVRFGGPDVPEQGAEKSGRSNGSMSKSPSMAKKKRSFMSEHLGLGEDAGNSAKAQRRRRRFWRKFWMKANPRYWFHVLNRSLPIIPGENPIRRYWDSLMLLLVVWACVIIPYQVGFGFTAPDRYPLSLPDEPRWPIAPMDNPPEPEGTVIGALAAVDYCMTALFLIDICVNFRTSYIDATATVVRDGKRIAVHYLHTWFPVDFIATIPWDLLVLMFITNPSQTTVSALLLLRLPRILRLARLLKVFDRLPGVSIIRITKLLFFIVIVSHWINCMWFFLFRIFRYHTDEPWSIELQVGMNSRLTTYYLNGYYNSFVLMIGNDIFPGNDIERTYCIFVIIVGACFYAIIIGNISLIINNMNPTNSRHKAKKDIINNSVRYLGAPKVLAGHVDDYFEYLTTFSHPGPDGMSLISQLPTSMYHDIASFMYTELVNKVPLFSDCEAAFIQTLVVRLKMSVYLPGETIFKNGDVGHEMYFIMKGNISVMNKHKEMLSMLSQGGFFGELALLATARRTAECVALSHCDLIILVANDLVAAMKDFPESAMKVQQVAVKRLSALRVGGLEVARGGMGAPRHLQQVHRITRNDSDDDEDESGDDSEDGDHDSTSSDDGPDREVGDGQPVSTGQDGPAGGDQDSSAQQLPAPSSLVYTKSGSWEVKEDALAKDLPHVGGDRGAIFRSISCKLKSMKRKSGIFGAKTEEEEEAGIRLGLKDVNEDQLMELLLKATSLAGKLNLRTDDVFDTINQITTRMGKIEQPSKGEIWDGGGGGGGGELDF